MPVTAAWRSQKILAEIGARGILEPKMPLELAGAISRSAQPLVRKHDM
jgi:hypothetical protein